MDDPTSRTQLDELGDLYLTGMIDEPDNTDASDQGSPVEGPEPIRLSPKLGGTNTSQSDAGGTTDGENTEPDDRHPVLRLTETEQENQQAANTQAGAPAVTGAAIELIDADDAHEPATQAVVEAVLLGNLPGMSGPWLTQYAQLIAQSEGPVALLHVGESAIDLELIEPRAEAEPSPAGSTAAVRIPPMRGNKTGLIGLLDGLTRSETSPTRTILVRMESANDPATLSRFAALDEWTLLCGSDDASIAGATQQLRQMVRADPRLADRNVGLMVMGSDEASARAAAGRVSDDMHGDLANAVQFIGHLKRMQPVQVREIGSFPDPVGVWPQLVAWFDTLEAPEPPELTAEAPPESTAQDPTATKTVSDTISRPVSPPKPQQLSREAASITAPASRPAPRPAFASTPPTKPHTKRPAAQSVEPQRTPSPPRPARAQTAPQPAPRSAASEPTRPAPQPRVLTPKAELDLVALVADGPAAIDSPAVLDARIPDQPDTQLAVDAQGVVHILMRHDTDTDASPDARQAVMQLIEAGRWVREHLELLALTERDRAFVDQEPTLHLMTDRADQATQLVGKLAGQVKLHLLQQVKLGRESGWFCTPLG